MTKKLLPLNANGVLQMATGIEVESLDIPASGARGFLQMEEYTEGEFESAALHLGGPANSNR